LYENGTRESEGTLKIGFLGRFNPIKRLDLMLEACRLGRGTDAEFRLMLAGSDEQGLTRSLTDRYQDLFAAGLACWMTPLDGQAKDAFLAGLDALILTSSFESYGIVILEAWAQGTPCIVTPTVGLASIVRERGGGVVLDEASAPAILRGVRQLQTALQRGQVDRSMLRALAVELGEQQPAHGILHSLEICGVSLSQPA
jgi:glycosyltransferase involved in cell wall biosynthesis